MPDFVRIGGQQNPLSSYQNYVATIPNFLWSNGTALKVIRGPENLRGTALTNVAAGSVLGVVPAVASNYFICLELMVYVSTAGSFSWYWGAFQFGTAFYLPANVYTKIPNAGYPVISLSTNLTLDIKNENGVAIDMAAICTGWYTT